MVMFLCNSSYRVRKIFLIGTGLRSVKVAAKAKYGPSGKVTSETIVFKLGKITND